MKYVCVKQKGNNIKQTYISWNNRGGSDTQYLEYGAFSDSLLLLKSESLSRAAKTTQINCNFLSKCHLKCNRFIQTNMFAALQLYNSMQCVPKVV